MAPGTELATVNRRPHELNELGRLLGVGLSEATARIGELQGAIAGRAFAASGAVAAPARALHDGISAGVYGAVRLAGSALLRAAGAVAASARPQDCDAVSRTRLGSFGIAATSGLIGDRLAREGSAFAPEMTLRAEGEPTPRIAVFVHGLCETDRSWRLGAQRQGGATYGSRLRDELGYTPVYVRYNTGLPVTANGRRLSALLVDLAGNWPVEVEEISFIGHSMGGLGARSAAYHGQLEGQAWVESVKHVFALGTPHLGAPLEQFVARTAPRLERVPELRPIARVLEARSQGIRDLHDGYICDEPTDVPLIEHAQHYAICATLTRRADSRLASIVGDLLVHEPSGSGRGRPGGRSITFPIENGLHVGGVSHFALLNHPAVYAQMRRWLAREPAAAGS